MAKLILFINSFLSYLLVFAVIVALVILAVFLGVKWKKHSDEKTAGGNVEPVMPDQADIQEQAPTGR